MSDLTLEMIQDATNAFHDKLVDSLGRPHPADAQGTQFLVRFANDFGASIVRFNAARSWDGSPYGSHRIKTGRWELAVIQFESRSTIHDGYITYATPITNAVLGYLTPENVMGHWHITYVPSITNDVLGNLTPKDVMGHLKAISEL